MADGCRCVGVGVALFDRPTPYSIFGVRGGAHPVPLAPSFKLRLHGRERAEANRSPVRHQPPAAERLPLAPRTRSVCAWS
eukprot:scaffold82863_cov31-Tisochrysis_lutea.AAC.4